MKKPLLGLVCALGISIACAQSAPTPAPAAAAPPPPPARGPSTALALEAVQAAIAACAKKGFPVGATVVDSGGFPKALLAADGTRGRAVQFSTYKAVTAIRFGDSTAAISAKMKTDPELAAKISSDPTLSAWPGAVLLKVGNEVIGALGVGGANPSEVDEECAKEGLKAVQARLR